MTPSPSLADSPVAWLALSFLAAVVAANLAWLAARRSPPRPDGALAAVLWLACSLFYLFPPILALRAGAISPALLGITEIEWLRTLNTGVPLALGVVAILLVGWLAYWRRDEAHHLAGPAQRIQILRGPLDALLEQWHWAFYRAAAISALPLLAAGGAGPLHETLPGNPLYWGSWLGMLFVGAEWLLNPWTRRSLRTPGLREAALRTAALAVVTTGLFIITGNFWLGALCHAAIEVAARARLPAPQPTPQQ